MIWPATRTCMFATVEATARAWLATAARQPPASDRRASSAVGLHFVDAPPVRPARPVELPPGIAACSRRAQRRPD